MNFVEIKKLVIAEYDSRDLATDIRPKALDSFEDYLKLKHLSCWNDVSKLPDNKGITKRAYVHFKGAALNDGESSMINEVYNQLRKQGIELTDYTKLLNT